MKNTLNSGQITNILTGDIATLLDALISSVEIRQERIEGLEEIGKNLFLNSMVTFEDDLNEQFNYIAI